MSEYVLVPFSPEQIDEWRALSLIEYAKEKQNSLGVEYETALAISHDSFSNLMPQGLLTKGSHLFGICQHDKIVGNVWFKILHKDGLTFAFVYDLKIGFRFRGQGAARAAMNLVEIEAKKMGATKISLHVFGQNKIAKALYDNLGYKVTDYSMAKEI